MCWLLDHHRNPRGRARSQAWSAFDLPRIEYNEELSRRKKKSIFVRSRVFKIYKVVVNKKWLLYFPQQPKRQMSFWKTIGVAFIQIEYRKIFYALLPKRSNANENHFLELRGFDSMGVARLTQLVLNIEKACGTKNVVPIHGFFQFKILFQPQKDRILFLRVTILIDFICR